MLVAVFGLQQAAILYVNDVVGIKIDPEIEPNFQSVMCSYKRSGGLKDSQGTK